MRTPRLRPIVLLVLIAVLLAALIGCTSAPAPQPPPAQPQPAQPAAPAAPKPAATAAPAAKPAATAAPAAKPAATAAPAAKPTAAPAAVVAPVVKPAGNPMIRVRDEQPAGQPRSGGDFRVMLRIDGQTLDPHKNTLATGYIYNEMLYDTLVDSEHHELTPCLAESWTISPDALTYTFKLRQGVKFHSGRTMTSADVKYSIERVRDPKTASPRLMNFEAVAEIQTPDPNTVVMKLKEPFAPLLANLAAIGTAIVDKELVEKGANLDQVGAGTGPFMLKEWARDNRLVVVKNPSYWRAGLPYLNSVTFTFNPDDNARAAAIRSGGVDFLYRADPVFVEAIKRDANLKWYGGASGSWSYVAMNVTRKPYDDVRVRQAIFNVLDRQAIMDVANSGLGEVLTGGFLSPSKWGALKTPMYEKPDLAKAKSLLAQTAVPNGFKTTLIVNSTSAFHVRAAQAVQQQVKALGIDIEIKGMESGVFNRERNSANFDLMVTAFGGVLDPDERLSQTFVSGAGSNYSRFSDKELDDLVAQARRLTNQAEREKVYEQTQKLLAERGPKAFTYGWADHDITLKKVQGYWWDPKPSYRSFAEVWLSE